MTDLTPEEQALAAVLDAELPLARDPQMFDASGHPITHGEFEMLLRRRSGQEVGAEYGRVGLDHVGQLRVSTVWLGIDHGFYRPEGYDGPTQLFETMVFVDDSFKELDDGEQNWTMSRYPDRASATIGHEMAVRFAAEHQTVSEFRTAMSEGAWS